MAWIGAWGTWGSWIAHQALVEDMVEEYLRLGVRSQESGEDMVEEHLGSGVRPATPFVIHYRASHISLWIYVPRLAKKKGCFAQPNLLVEFAHKIVTRPQKMQNYF